MAIGIGQGLLLLDIIEGETSVLNDAYGKRRVSSATMQMKLLEQLTDVQHF